ncbi:MAG: LysM peptidoglycan-binding domain-containing protein [PVC group bacterium]|nr:LysM peptidoglycan-binding domain-containing protein [PVC group bacterium]
MKKIFSFTFLLLLSLILSSCVSTATQPPVTSTPVPKSVYRPPSPKLVTPPNITSVRKNITHVVAPGETVWRISKMYDVQIKDIVRANSLKNERELEMGQRLRIPGACPVKPIISLYPSKKWKYIIIHHSATGEGGALQFHRGHTSKGWDSLGYHFVIDNGTSSKCDGQIETSPRWLKQQNGAHCKAASMNHKAIGICLVGNFSKERVTKKQMESLLYLVNQLKKYYKIPRRNIIGHGKVKGATTECPGKKFPWKTFWSNL